MKRLVALLLVLCLAFGLVACAKPTTDPKDTTANNGNNSANPTGNNGGNGGDVGNADYTEPNSNDKYINPAFEGKSLQLWGLSAESFKDIENMARVDYEWMVRAAIDEWAALNKVDVEFVADYNEAQILSAINNGDTPDLLLRCNFFPTVAAQGIVRAFTEQEYKQLSAICGNQYLDMMDYKGEIYGFHVPWGGSNMFYYNKTMFENYDVKTPKEYYMEDNWTWDTMVKCWEDITKDLDGDGKMDTYGIGCYNAIFESFPIEEDEDGNIHSTVLSDKYRKQREILYKGLVETGSMQNNNSFCTVSRNPRPGTMCSDAEWYNFSHLLQSITNGDVLEVVPVPSYDAEDPVNPIHLNFMSIFSTCDEPEAALSLLSYVLKVGMRYMSDYSVGLYNCEYEGMRGATEYSKIWKESMDELVVDRKEEFDMLEDWDQEFYNKMVADVLSRRSIYYRYYFGQAPVISADIEKLPSASAISQISAIYEAYCTKYNDLYAN